MAKIQLASNFSIPAVDYAAQGNSIIGIRNSGKTYSATKVAEELMKAGIPIIAFDPTGVWQNLRNGTGGHTGFPVVVAGGLHPDLPLSEDNATRIVEAALKEGISLIIDLKGTATSNKTKWIRIVTDCVEFLMGHNDQYGLRHVFIEEAAEFVPQVPSPGGKVVYSRIESLARMGRNFGLGYTLINQRAEEIAKAVFEISEMVLVHRQAGKNSLNSIKKWLEIRNDEQETEIIKSLPKLENGQCWAINEMQSTLITVLPKQTFHPDPKKGKTSLPQNTKVADRSLFIKKLNNQLGEIEVELKTVKELQAEVKRLNGELRKASQPSKNVKSEVDTALIEKLKAEKEQYRNMLNTAIASSKKLEEDRRRLKRFLVKQTVDIKQILERNIEWAELDIPEKTTAPTRADIPVRTMTHQPAPVRNTNTSVPINVNGNSGAMRMLKAAAMYYPNSTTVQRMAALAGMSHTSGTFGVYFRSLKRDGLIDANGKIVKATEAGVNKAGDFPSLPTDPDSILEMWCNNVGSDSGMAKILRFLFQQHPNWITAEELGQAVGMSHTSGTFGVYERKLRKLALIEKQSGQFKASDELFN